MRIVHTAFLSLVLAGAVPSAGSAQVLTPFAEFPGLIHDQHLDHPVPVATVSRVGDIVTLSGARIVDDGHGEPFVLGAASLDLHDPVHAKVRFTIANATDAPIPLDDVMINATSLCSISDPDHPYAYPQYGIRAGGFHGTAQLQPGEKASIQIPIPPSCDHKAKARGVALREETLGILVAVVRPGPHESMSAPELRSKADFYLNQELFFRVFDRLRAEALHP
jgi:hypothetical protein